MINKAYRSFENHFVKDKRYARLCNCSACRRYSPNDKPLLLNEPSAICRSTAEVVRRPETGWRGSPSQQLAKTAAMKALMGAGQKVLTS